MTSPPDLSIFRRGLRRQRLVLLLFAPVALALAVLLPVLASDPSQGVSPVAAGVFSAFMGAGAIWLSSTALRPIEGVPMMRVLRERPTEIVWVYPIHHNRYGMHVATSLTFNLANGKSYRAPLTKEEEAPALALVRQLCPGVQIGHSAALAARFKTNPAALRNA
jgi:hypothetical protein